MELRQLRSFCMAAKLRSISKAAEQLGSGQPTVTTHVKKLEEELGTVLFDRVRRPIQLTPAGAALAKLAAPLVEGIGRPGRQCCSSGGRGADIGGSDLRHHPARPAPGG